MHRRGLTALVLCAAVAAAFCGRREAASPAAPPPAAATSSTAPAAAAGSAASAPAAPAASNAGLLEDKALADGRLITVRHNKFDLGQSSDLFDGKPETFARTEKANPAVLEFVFPEPRPLKGVWLKLAGEDFRVTATVKHAGGAPKTYTRELPHSGFDPEIELDFGGDSAPVESVRLELFALRSSDGHIHIRTVRFR